MLPTLTLPLLSAHLSLYLQHAAIRSLAVVMALIPQNPAVDLVEDDETVCIKEHCFRCFDALFCALTGHKAIATTFPDDK